jgi:pimeloyl-ACP methyl ester carboxylesterase
MCVALLLAYDVVSQVSLTDFLAAAGWDVWVIDIRGNGLADKASRIDIEQDWNIDDYLVQVCVAESCR